jgi:hypothetical protein
VGDQILIKNCGDRQQNMFENPCFKGIKNFKGKAGMVLPIGVLSFMSIVSNMVE